MLKASLLDVVMVELMPEGCEKRSRFKSDVDGVVEVVVRTNKRSTLMVEAVTTLE